MSYDPSIGRWLEEDPISFAGGTTNLHEFVGNDPTNRVDPSGLEAVLSYDTIEPPTPGNNGAFSTKIRWKVTGNVKGGVIIQQVNFEYHVADACGNPITVNTYLSFLKFVRAGDFDTAYYPYQEAWQVSPRAKETTVAEKARKAGDRNPYDDLVSSIGFDDPVKPTVGSLAVTLEAKFYEGGVVPDDFKVLRHAPAAELPVKYSLKKNTTLPAGGSNMVVRKYLLSWNTPVKGLEKTRITDVTPKKGR